MRYQYTEWDGSEFPTQDHMKIFDSLAELVLEFGDQALDALRQLENDEEQSKLLQQLIDDGLLEKAGARWRLTPRAAIADVEGLVPSVLFIPRFPLLSSPRSRG